MLAVQSVSSMINPRTGGEITNDNTETYVKFGEHIMIPMTKDEMDDLKKGQVLHDVHSGGSSSSSSSSSSSNSMETPVAGIKLLFFAPASVITPELNLTSPSFFFPDEKRMTGSGTLCGALVAEMVKQHVVAIVRYMRSSNATAHLAALFPQEEVLDTTDNTSSHTIHISPAKASVNSFLFRIQYRCLIA